MELLPPVGWADVATKQDLRFLELRFESFEHRMDAKFEKGFRQVIVTMTSLLISGFLATIVATAVAVALR